MSTKFNMTKDIAGYNGFGLIPSDDNQATSLAQNAAQTITVPAQYKYYIAIFSFTPGANVWVDFSGATATVPGSTIGSVTTELNPAGRLVKGGTTMSVITADSTTPFINVLFYVAPPWTN